MADIQNLTVNEVSSDVELISDFGEGKKITKIPYDFSITIHPNEHVGKNVSGKLEVSDSFELKFLNDSEYQDSDGMFNSIVLEDETIRFRAFFTEPGTKTMTFTINDGDTELKKIEKSMEVTAFIEPEISVSVEPAVLGEEFGIYINVTANDMEGMEGRFSYEFSEPLAIKHIEQYISDEASQLYGTWVEVDSSNIATGEMRTVKNETIQLKVDFMKDGTYDFTAKLNELSVTKEIVVTKPIEITTDDVEIEVALKPDGSLLDIDKTQKQFTFEYQNDVSNDFWVKYKQELDTDGEADKAFAGVRFVAPESATHWKSASASTDWTELNVTRYVDLFFPIAEKNNDNIFHAFTQEKKYKIDISFAKKVNGNYMETYNEEFDTTVVPVEEDVTTPEEPNNPKEFEAGKYLLLLLKGYHAEDLIDKYGFENGWTQEQMDEAAVTYRDNFGRFALDQGLVTTNVGKMFLNYLKRYTLIDSANKLGTIDLEQTREEYKTILEALDKGPEEVLKVIEGLGVDITEVTPETDLNKPNEPLIIVGGEEALTGKVEIAGSSVSAKNMNFDSAGVTIKSDGKISIKSSTTTGKHTSSNTQFAITTPDEVILESLNIQAESKNAIEIGLNAKVEPPKQINITDVVIEKLGNNGLNFFGQQDGAVIIVKDAVFKNVSNPIRISNRTNTTAVFNFYNCKCELWSEAPYAGFILFEDYTSKSVDKETENNLFAPEKIIINLYDCYGPNGKITMPKDLALVCGTGKNDQLFYVYNDKGGMIPYTKERYPQFNIQ